jgi:hypothetical protein
MHGMSVLRMQEGIKMEQKLVSYRCPLTLLLCGANNI